MIRPSHSLRPWFLLFLFFLPGCQGGEETDGLFLLAAEALGPEAHKNREMVVNPRLLGQDNPRIPDRALLLLQEAGFGLIGADGQEDPEKATLYFTPPEALEEGLYQLRVFVSMGARFGTMHRGDTWWRVLAECRERCEVLEITSISPPKLS